MTNDFGQYHGKFGGFPGGFIRTAGWWGLKIPTNQFWANSQRIQDPLSTVIILHACVNLEVGCICLL